MFQPELHSIQNLEKLIAQLRQWETLYSLHQPELAIYAQYVQHHIFVEWTNRLQAFLSLKTRVCWMLSSDDYAVAKRHGGDPATIQGCEADPKAHIKDL